MSSILEDFESNVMRLDVVLVSDAISEDVSSYGERVQSETVVQHVFFVLRMKPDTMNRIGDGILLQNARIFACPVNVCKIGDYIVYENRRYMVRDSDDYLTDPEIQAIYYYGVHTQ